jgi:hypothetical protein
MTGQWGNECGRRTARLIRKGTRGNGLILVSYYNGTSSKGWSSFLVVLPGCYSLSPFLVIPIKGTDARAGAF